MRHSSHLSVLSLGLTQKELRFVKKKGKNLCFIVLAHIAIINFPLHL